MILQFLNIKLLTFYLKLIFNKIKPLNFHPPFIFLKHIINLTLTYCRFNIAPFSLSKGMKIQSTYRGPLNNIILRVKVYMNRLAKSHSHSYVQSPLALILE